MFTFDGLQLVVMLVLDFLAGFAVCAGLMMYFVSSDGSLLSGTTANPSNGLRGAPEDRG